MIKTSNHPSAPHFCEWQTEPHHNVLLQTPSFIVFEGHLGPHGQTLMHAHRNPTACVSILGAASVVNRKYTAIATGAEPDAHWPSTIAKGATFVQHPPPNDPYIHAVSTAADPVLFLCVEVLSRVRRTGAAAPPLLVAPATGVSARDELKDDPFSSAVALTLQPGAAAELRAAPLPAERVLVRLISRVDGPALPCVQVRACGDAVVQYVEYAEFDPPAQAFVVTGFPEGGGDAGNAVCAVHNLGDEAAELVAIDVFTADPSDVST